MVPNPGNPMDWDRYAYVQNNPVNLVDPDGHFAIIPFLVAAVKAISTAVDWGWTAYDTVNYVSVALDPNNTPEVQKVAWGNAAMAVGMELIEPDEGLSPIALPIDDIVRHGDEIGEELLRVVPADQVGTSQAFKLRKDEDGLSVFEGVSPDEVLSELPGNRVPNTTVTIPKNQLPPGTQIIATLSENLSQRLSEAHRILIRPEGWSVDRFAKTLKEIVGWK